MGRMEFGTFVLAASTADLSEEPAAREHADAVEFRMDLADEPLGQLDAYDGELPLIATNRVEWDGGEASDDDARLDALTEATTHPAVEAVDVELEAVQAGIVEDVLEDVLDGDRTDAERVVDAARDADVAVIASAHDFEGMPGRDGIRRILMRAEEIGDVAKFAGTATTVGDALDLLAITHERTEADETVATMAMGEAGRHTRAVAPVYGSRIGYAPVDPARATAPGQFDLATLRSLVDRLLSGTTGKEDSIAESARPED